MTDSSYGAGTIAGTVAYMSPEQVRGEVLDARSDLFSFGAVLYEMATATVAFPGNRVGSVFDAILNRTPAPAAELNPSLPPALSEIIHKSLEKDREQRYQRAADIRADLRRLMRELEAGVAPAVADRLETPQDTARSDLSGMTVAATATPAPIVGERELTESAVSRKGPTQKLLIAIPILLLALAIIAGYRWRGHKTTNASATGPVSIAVLPFVNLSSDNTEEYFSDGLADELINDLAKVPGVRVAARSSAFQFKGKERTLRSTDAGWAWTTCWKGRCASKATACESPPSLPSLRMASNFGRKPTIARSTTSSGCRKRSHAQLPPRCKLSCWAGAKQRPP